MAPVRFIRGVVVAAAMLFAGSTVSAETVMVHRRTRVKARPDRDADTVIKIKEDRPAKVLRRRGGGWVKVRIGDEVGWIRRSQIEEDQADDDEPADEDEEVAAAAEDEEPSTTAARAQPRFAATAALGLRTLSSAFSSDGAMDLGNYRLSARAYGAAVGLDIVAYRSGQLVGIIDGRYQGAVATPGVQFATSDQATGYVPFTAHDIDVGARVGYGFAWLRASGRVGYHAGIVHVEKLDNVGKMPSEVLTGTTIGAALEAPFTGEGWSARATFDRLVGGKRKQTKGLEDGSPGAVSASWIGLAVGYALSPRLQAEAGYRRARATSSWTGTSAREADITSARRTDASQQFTIGLTQAF